MKAAEPSACKKLWLLQERRNRDGFWMLSLKAVGAWSHQLAGGPMQKGREEMQGSSLLPQLSGRASHCDQEYKTSAQCPEDYFNLNKKGISSNDCQK